MVGVLVGGGCSGRPLIGVAQRGEVAAVLDARDALKLLTHSVTIEDVTLTRRTWGEDEGKERGRFTPHIKAGSLIWPRTRSLSPPTVPVPSKPVCQPTEAKLTKLLVLSLAASR